MSNLTIFFFISLTSILLFATLLLNYNRGGQMSLPIDKATTTQYNSTSTVPSNVIKKPRDEATYKLDVNKITLIGIMMLISGTCFKLGADSKKPVSGDTHHYFEAFQNLTCCVLILVQALFIHSVLRRN